MARVKGPNGLVVDVPDTVASGLVGDGQRGYEYVKDEPPAERKPERKPAPKKKSKKS